MADAARKLPSGKPGLDLQGKEQAPKSVGHRFQPGQSGNPKGRPPGQTREAIVRSFFELLSKKAKGEEVTYLEVMMARVLASEHLLSKFLDKLLPNMSQDQTNLVFNNFEAILAQVQAQRAALAFTQSPGLPPVVPVVSTPEPELEPVNRKSGG